MTSKYFMLIAFVFLVGLLTVSAQQTRPYLEADGEVYDGRIEQVKGKVVYLNHPELGNSPASGHYLVFQRDGCKDCLVATHADVNGNYKIFLGIGKYRLIVSECICDYGGAGCDCYNLLSASQAQYITVERGRPYGAEFNIELVLKKR